MSELPQGWINAKLPNIAEIIMGQSPPSDTYNTQKNGLPFFQGKAEFGSLYPTVKKYCSEPGKIAEAGDILMSVRAPVGPTNLCTEKSCIGRGLAAIRHKEATTTEFLLYFFRHIEPWLSTQGTGSTFTAISRTDLDALEVFLPPLNEQRRIVAKLELLLSRVDACQQRLARIPVILKRFRQAVLAAACSGRLTADWRELNNLDDWEWSILSKQDISIQTGPFGSALHKHDYVSNGIPLVNPMHIREGQIYPNTNQSVSEGKLKELTRYLLNPGDIVLGRRGEMGRAAVVRSSRLLCGTGSLFLRTTSEKVVPDFLCLLLRSPQTCAYLEEGSVGSTMTNLNQQIVGSLEFPIASPGEQQEIVRRVEELFKLADQLEARYTTAQAQVDKLTQSILAKAFRGELVPQDPSDEPAEKLLERILEQQETVAAQPRKKRSPPVQAVQDSQPVSASPEQPVTTPPDLSKTARKILRHMKKGHTYAKHELTTAAILSTSEWNSAIRELKEAGLVIQSGDKRGAAYHKA